MTNEAKHTPGPWGYEDPMGPDILTIVANPYDPVYEWVWVAQIGTAVVEDDDGKVIDQRPYWEHEANARLIAAAPDLLAALIKIEAALRKDSRDKTIARDTVEYHLDGQVMYAAINCAREAIAKAEAAS